MKCKKSVPYLYIISVILLILLISPNIRGDNGITVLTPIENSVYQTGDSCIIRWGINQETFQVDIYLYKDSYQTRTIAIGIVNRRSYEWFIPGVVGESENFQIKVVDHDDPLNYDFSDHFTIHYPPSISIHSPRSDTVWKTGSKYKISWSFQSPISSINIFLFKTSENVLNIAVKASNSGIYYWIIPQSLEESSSYINQLCVSVIYEWVFISRS